MRRVVRVVGAVATAVAALAAAPGAAQEPSKLYAGVGLAVADFQSDHDGIVFSAEPLGWQIYGGLQARELVAVELAVDGFAGIESGEILGSGVERLRISAEQLSATVRGVFSLPLDGVLPRRKITLFAAAGAMRSVERRSVLELYAQQQTSVSERDTALVVGVGATFDLARVRVRAHLQQIDRAGGQSSAGAAVEFRF